MKYIIAGITLFLSSITVSAQKRSTELFLDKLEQFVDSVKTNDSVINWTKDYKVYKKFRTDFKTTYKKRMNDKELLRYNKLQARYVKFMTIKKPASEAKQTISTISSTVKGTFQGIFGE